MLVVLGLVPTRIEDADRGWAATGGCQYLEKVPEQRILNVRVHACGGVLEEHSRVVLSVTITRLATLEARPFADFAKANSLELARVLKLGLPGLLRVDADRAWHVFEEVVVSLETARQNR